MVRSKKAFLPTKAIPSDEGLDSHGDPTATVQCGEVEGYLHRDQFYCPGIHQACIQLKDGSFVTPKTFTVLGDKQKLKDWKNAIRIENISIRKAMDRGTLDFYDHSTHCTGRCVGRAIKEELENSSFDNDSSLPTMVPIKPHGLVHSSMKDNVSPVTPLKTVTTPPSILIQHRNFTSTPVFPNPVSSTSKLQMIVSSPAKMYSKFPPKVSVVQSVQRTEASGIEFSKANKVIRINDSNAQDGTPINNASLVTFEKSDSESIGAGMRLSVRNTPIKQEPIDGAAPTEDCPDSENGLDDKQDVLKENQKFWRGIRDVGQLNETFNEIHTAIETFKIQLLQGNIAQNEAMRLTRVITELGLMDRITASLNYSRALTDQEEIEIDEEMETLQRKMEEAQKKKQQLKRKAEYYDTLLGLNNAKRSPASSPSSSSMMESSLGTDEDMHVKDASEDVQ